MAKEQGPRLTSWPQAFSLHLCQQPRSPLAGHPRSHETLTRQIHLADPTKRPKTASSQKTVGKTKKSKKKKKKSVTNGALPSYRGRSTGTYGLVLSKVQRLE